jgi:amino acid adenylation domain-containing protein
MHKTDYILVNRVIRAAQKYPDRPAVMISDQVYSYSQLLQRASSFANSIHHTGDRALVVGILAHHSIDAYAGILGILLAGKGYLPLNPRFPAHRNLLMLKRSGAQTLIAGKECLDSLNEILDSAEIPLNLIVAEDFLPEEIGNRNLHHLYHVERQVHPDIRELETDPDSLAYLLFTSGSTGSPKGVAVFNRNVTAYLDNLSSLVEFSPEDRFTQTFDLTFDLSVHDLFVCWSAGACLCVPEDNSSFGLSRYLRQMQPTVWFSVPSVAFLMDRMRLLKDNSLPWLRLSFFCGEALHVSTAAAWKRAAPRSEVFNLYGPTEATIAVSAYRVPEDIARVKERNGIVSIGRLFEGHEFILEGDQPMMGMLHIIGPQVVMGYFKDDLLTEKYFAQKGTSSLNYYNSGDLVEQDEQGDLFFLGRADSEVKISGYRVNLQEIDHTVASLDNVRQAVTLYLTEPDSESFLVTFIVPHTKKDDIFFVLEHCRKMLPHYMVPEKIIFVDELPLNPNGKTDRNALAETYRQYHGKGY